MHTLPNDPRLTNAVRSHEMLQEGLSCTLATLRAIVGAGFLDALPEGEDAKAQHNHGLWLLSMLEDKLTAIQAQIDAADAPAPASKSEG